MKKIEFVAYQLSKITDNYRYEYSEEYYENLKNPYVGQMERRIEEFFKDAPIYLSACALSDIDHKFFMLDFENEEMLRKAIPVLQSHDLLWEDDVDNPFFEIDNQNHKFQLFISMYSVSAYDFIFGNHPDKISILRLSELLCTKIDFIYNFAQGQTFIDDDSRRGSAMNGKIEYRPQITVNEIRELKDIPEFNAQLFCLIDIAPDLQKFKKLNPKIVFKKAI